jgi:hypothetical protein
MAIPGTLCKIKWTALVRGLSQRAEHQLLPISMDGSGAASPHVSGNLTEQGPRLSIVFELGCKVRRKRNNPLQSTGHPEMRLLVVVGPRAGAREGEDNTAHCFLKGTKIEWPARGSA